MIDIEKRDRVDGYDLRYSSDWTGKLEGQGHWVLYWNQANIVWGHVPKHERVLEVGVGSGFLSNYLRHKGWSVKTVDIDTDKKPDMVGDISTLDVFPLNCSVVLAFEVFEHIPFPLFRRAIENISKSPASKIAFSVPWSIRSLFKASVKLPKVSQKNVSMWVGTRKIKTANHYWELSRKPCNDELPVSGQERGVVELSSMREVFERYGFHVQLLHSVGRIQFAIATR